MLHTIPKVFILAAFLLGACFAIAQDSGPLIDVLIRKGIITDQEGEEIRAELAADSHAATTKTIAGGKSTRSLSIAGRIQAQYVNFSTDIDGASDPVSANHFFMRRVYFGAKAKLNNSISAAINYEFAGGTFDAAYIRWTQSPEFWIDVGFRKTPIGYDEWLTSSGKLKPIERSAVTRYFVEANNGRRLGAGSYRQGVFLNGKKPSGFNYQFAITNPERNDANVGRVGDSSNNNFAYWAQAGFNGKSGATKYIFGGSLGYLPDQGGKTVGKGDDLSVAGFYTDISNGPFSIQGEFYTARNEHGASATQDANPWGWYIQPSYRIGSKYELVARIGHVDSDGRGISLSDGIRSGPSGGTMNTEDELYLGGNWYINGWDTVLMAGYVWGKTNDKLSGAPAEATVQGLRSQLQVNF